jgi:hypothetical protein
MSISNAPDSANTAGGPNHSLANEGSNAPVTSNSRQEDDYDEQLAYEESIATAMEIEDTITSSQSKRQKTEVEAEPETKTLT